METLGQKLKAARLEKKLTASEAARGTRIKIQHIEAMERDDFSSIAAPAYAKGFIRIYTELLGLDAVPLIQEYMDQHAPAERSPLLQDASGKRESSPGVGDKAFTLPALPNIPWDKIKLPKIKIPKIAVPRIPKRLLIVYGAAALIFLFILVTVIRCGRVQDAPAPLPVIEQRVPVLAPVGDARISPQRPLPVVDALPEPYLE